MNGEGPISDLPPPPVGPEVDLTDLPYMPLYGERLFDSDSWAYASDEARVAALQLWWKAWRQVPAGSLPDDDVILAKLAGYGRALKAWARVRKQALRGFVKCSDGRLYHFVLCEIALQSFESSRARRERREQDRARKRASRGGPSGSGSADCPQGVRRNSGGQGTDKRGVSGGNPSPKGSKGKERPSTGACARADGTGDTGRNSGGQGVSVSTGQGADLSGGQAADVVALFDRIRNDIFGEAARRPWPHATDALTARRWLEAGAGMEMLREVIREVMDRQGRTSPHDPPASLKFCDRAVQAALHRDRTGKAAKARALARAFLDGDWRAEWGPQPGKPGSAVSQGVLDQVKRETADNADTDKEAGDD